MNDRYLYRAKRIDNGEWVEGNLVELGKESYSDEIRYGITEKSIPILGKTVFNLSIDEVDPSTICQCTGLRGKNGKLIYENDICCRILLPTKRIKTNFRIAYVPLKCCLSAIDLEGSNITFLSDYINNQYEVEVIGNIFDNPELLEVGECLN